MSGSENESLLQKIVSRLVERQGELGITNQAVCDAAGVSIPVWSGLKSGKRDGLQLNTLERLAVALSLDIRVEFTELANA